MDGWTVTLTLTNPPVRLIEERLYDDHDAIVATGEDDWEVTLSIDTAPDALAAAHAGLDAVRGAGWDGDVTGVDAITWAEHDRRLAEPAYPELVDVTGIAQLLGVSTQRASQLQTTDGFPAPHQRLSRGAVWLRATIETWAESWERKPGRPRKAS